MYRYQQNPFGDLSSQTQQQQQQGTDGVQSSYVNFPATGPGDHHPSAGAMRGLVEQQGRALIADAPLSNPPTSYRLSSPPHGSLGGYATAGGNTLQQHHQQQQQAAGAFLRGDSSALTYFPSLYPSSGSQQQQQSLYGTNTAGEVDNSHLMRGQGNLDLDSRKVTANSDMLYPPSLMPGGDASSFTRLSMLTSSTQGSRLLQQQQTSLYGGSDSKEHTSAAAALLQSLHPPRFGQEVDGGGVWRPY